MASVDSGEVGIACEGPYCCHYDEPYCCTALDRSIIVGTCSNASGGVCRQYIGLRQKLAGQLIYERAKGETWCNKNGGFWHVGVDDCPPGTIGGCLYTYSADELSACEHEEIDWYYPPNTLEMAHSNCPATAPDADPIWIPPPDASDAASDAADDGV